MTVTPVPPRGVRQRTDVRSGARPIGGVDAGSSPQPEPWLRRSVGSGARPPAERAPSEHTPLVWRDW